MMVVIHFVFTLCQQNNNNNNNNNNDDDDDENLCVRAYMCVKFDLQNQETEEVMNNQKT